jgi:RNA polymerase sigma-70 factor (ECF subfamily)
MTNAVDADADFESLIAAHRGIILKVAASYCRHADDRADLAQEIALQLWRAWPSYESGRPFSTWMYRVALNVAITQQRRERQRERHEPLSDEHEALVGARDVDVESRERLAIVQRAMQALSALDRALLLLHLEGCSHRESGEVLGMTEGNVATRLGRIKQQLRQIAGAASTSGAHDND